MLSQRVQAPVEIRQREVGRLLRGQRLAALARGGAQERRALRGIYRQRPVESPGKSFQISLALGDSPTIVLVLENFHGAGDYDSESQLRADYFGEGVRQSRGRAKAKIEVAPPTGAETRSVISGSFKGTYDGEAGKGTISAKFDKCLYELPKS